MDILLLIAVAIISFSWGWNAREQVAQHQNRKFFKKLVEQSQENIEQNLVRIKIEKHEGVLYAYEYDNSLFIAQANDRKELEEKLSQKYPGKRFGCSEENLKEVGFTS